MTNSTSHGTLIWRAQGKRCAGCGQPLQRRARRSERSKPNGFSVDHFIPRALGGLNELCNKLAMHRRCNSAKGDRMPNGCERIWHALVLAKLGLSA